MIQVSKKYCTVFGQYFGRYIFISITVIFSMVSRKCQVLLLIGIVLTSSIGSLSMNLTTPQKIVSYPLPNNGQINSFSNSSDPYFYPSTKLNLGNATEGIAIDNQNHLLYIAGESSKFISVINISTNQLIGSISIPYIANELTYDPVNHLLYAPSEYTNYLVYVNTFKQSVSQVYVGATQYDAAFDPSNGYLYLSNSGGSVLVINSTNSIVANITVTSQSGIAFDPSNGLIYETGFNNYVYVISPTSNTIVKTIQVGSGSRRAAYDPINGYMYVTNSFSDNVSIINSSTNSIVGSITVGGSPIGIEYDPINSVMVVENYESNNVYVLNVNTSSGKLVQTIPGSRPWEGLINPSSGDLYISNTNSTYLYIYTPSTDYNSIATYNLSNGTLIPGNEIRSNSLNPTNLLFDPYNGYIYVNEYNQGIVTVLNNSFKILTNITVGVLPWELVYDPVNHYVYDTDLSLNTVYVISGLSIISTIAVGSSPHGIAYDQYNNLIYVANYRSDSVSIISNTSVTNNVTVGTNPNTITVDNRSGYVYVTNLGSDNISILSPENVVVNTVALTFGPMGVIYDQLNNQIYVSSAYDGTISKINASSEQIIQTFNSINQIWWFTINPSNGNILGTNPNNNTTEIISNTTVDQIIQVGQYPQGVIWDQNINAAVVANMHSGTLTILYFTNVIPEFVTTFTESGLPSGTAWYVNITGQQTSGPITQSSYSVSLINGTYTYSISIANKDYAPNVYSGSLTVSGPSVPTPEITFSLETYTLTFTESGLQTGTWYVNLSNGDQGSAAAGSPITFSLPNDTYSYTISTSNKLYHPSSYTGTVDVIGNTPVSILFVQTTYSVQFTESGLPSGTTWYVNLSNGLVSGSITGTSYSFSLTNGTYSYTVSNVSGYSISSSSGSIMVNGNGISKSVSYAATSPGKTPSSGIPVVEIYGIIGAVVAVAAIVSVIVVFRKRR